MGAHRHCTGAERADLHRRFRALIESGVSILNAAPALGCARAHAYRIAKAAGVKRYYLTPEEHRLIEERRASFADNPS